MNDQLLNDLGQRPLVYERGVSPFWDDAHISKMMLETHLDNATDLATRKREFVRQSAEWIANTADPHTRPQLLDLGCGPGIYAQLFAKSGFAVTGVDISPRSVAYAQESAADVGLPIQYLCQNYLTLDYCNQFDVVTLIYCDFGVLSKEERELLLKKVHTALRPGGLFIFDVLTLLYYQHKEEKCEWHYSEGGFWSEKPHACLYAFYRYDDSQTFLDRYVIAEKEDVRCYNIWNHGFTQQELRTDLTNAGFAQMELFGDVAGASLEPDSQTMCVVARKE